jgi:ABC-type bacteriocin/lantibiotic exporter with double-glycine peptidase domain
MMLTAVSVDLPYRQLLSILDIAPWETPHRNFRQLGERFKSIHGLYKQGTLPDLFQAIDTGHPVAVFVWTGDLPYWIIETWHAVVIVGYDEQDFYLNDPAFDNAPQIVSHGDLDLAWIAYDSYFAIIERV